MSIRLMTLVWDIRWPTQNHLLVMLKLADHANDEGGKVWPAVSTISEQAQCSERTVQNVLKAFRDCGLISVLKQGGGSSPTVYGLNVPLLRGLVGRTLEGCADRIEIPDDVTDDTGATIAPLSVAPVQPTTSTGATVAGEGCKAFAPKPPSKPSKEPSRAGAREEVSIGFGSEGVIVTKTDNPQALIAWERYADKRQDQHEWRVAKRLIRDHGAWKAPSLYPPDFAPNLKEAAE